MKHLFFLSVVFLLSSCNFNSENPEPKSSNDLKEYLLSKLGSDKFTSCCRLESVLGKGDKTGLYEPEFKHCLKNIPNHYETVYKQYCIDKIDEVLGEWATSKEEIDRVLNTKYVMDEEDRQFRIDNKLPYE